MNITQKLPQKLAFPISLEVAQKLLNTYNSPLYVYQGEILRHTIQQISQSIPYPKTAFHFASVTNGNVSLLKIFHQSGWGIHANTPGDIYLALQAGFPPDRIVYSGSNLNRTDLHQVLAWGVTTLNLDSQSQLELFADVFLNAFPEKKIRLGLRLNLPELTGDSRIGVRPDEFSAAGAIAASIGLKVNGLHFYRGTGTNATPAFTGVISQILSIAQQLPDWEYLDFGGGFGYPYRPDGVRFDWNIFGAELTQHLQKIGKDIDLIIEPGRAAIAKCGILLTRVVSVKWQNDKQIVGVDTTIANLAVLAVHGGEREIISLRASDSLYTTDICGNTTYSRDYLGKNCQLPILQTGDILVILDVGAYGYAMSSHFLHRCRPAEILIENNREQLIRQREDYSILLQNQVF